MRRAALAEVQPGSGEEEAGGAWLPPAAVALHTGYSERHVRRIAQQALAGAQQPQKGNLRLVVRAAPPGAAHAVEVLSTSLPAAAQQALARAAVPLLPAVGQAVTTDRQRVHERQILAPALALPKGSPARAKEVKALASVAHHDPETGRMVRYSKATLYRMIERHEAAPVDLPATVATETQRPGAKVLISREWDKACPLEESTKRSIAAAVEEHVKSLWRGGFNGWSICAQHATTKLVELCQVAGWTAAGPRVCQVPRRFVERPASIAARALAILERNANFQYSLRDPRIRRSREGLMPFEIVCLDVHPLDIVVRRADGSEATPRLITWMCVATGLSYSEFVLCEKGTGIRQSHIVGSFVRLVMKHGLPRVLQIDNGSENASKALHNGFKTLRSLVEDFRDFCARLRADRRSRPGGWDIHFGVEDCEGPGGQYPDIMVAQPYRPASKPVERLFALLESRLQPVEGYIGGDRMNKLTHKRGAAPRVFGGSLDELNEVLAAAVRAHNAQPSSEDGQSPNDRLATLQARQVADPSLHRAPAVDVQTLAYAIATEKTLTIQNDGITAEGVRYYGDELVMPYHTRKVLVRIPAFEAGMIFVRLPGNSGFSTILRDKTFAYEDREGAKEQARRLGVQRRALELLKQGAPKIDAHQEMLRHAAALPDTPPNLKGPTISLVGDVILLPAPSNAQPAAAEADAAALAPADAAAGPLAPPAPAPPRWKPDPESLARLKALAQARTTPQPTDDEGIEP